jgi:hypothetical protein
MPETPHVCSIWMPDPDTWGPDDRPPPGPDWVCEECRAPMEVPAVWTPCPGCGELLPFEKVLGHRKCGYTAPG